ncbi:hypothetical protein SORBI_3001G510650 [Sorghum bicolor]|uniref:Uncharacterized protein n=1 Tax=Sorghum bicolor TaxID=4558 RepID=A0A1Z5SBH5_SORBI|nr:hypothetical protein SORBI_3001G510650 [Sorghum bicolor]OQU93269.1 hypothetical protein SORBI_3001G510650 [Sorghum bicolor]OQU93270.1 hypothetical protein SORBI_3001G510650 [Sorghum bicolor]OQU93271.1 hypothetical protein SORBI_3001G510650 [Sorghum bicolor]
MPGRALLHRARGRTLRLGLGRSPSRRSGRAGQRTRTRGRDREGWTASVQPSTSPLCTPCPPRFLLLPFPRVSSRFHPVRGHTGSEGDTARGGGSRDSSLTQPNLDTRSVCAVDLGHAVSSPAAAELACVPGTNGGRSSVKLMKAGERGVYALVYLNQSV